MAIAAIALIPWSKNLHFPRITSPQYETFSTYSHTVETKWTGTAAAAMPWATDGLTAAPLQTPFFARPDGPPRKAGHLSCFRGMRLSLITPIPRSKNRQFPA